MNKSPEQIKEEAIKCCETIKNNILNNQEDFSSIPGFWITAINMCLDKIKKIEVNE